MDMEVVKRWQLERSVLQSYKSDLPEDNRVTEISGGKVYICDHEKNTRCKKTGCGYLGRGECFHTTNKEFEKEEN